MRIGIGQTRERIDWFAEMEQPSILGLPNDAVVAAPQGQLGLGGTYYAANLNETNNASVFLKQAYVDFKHLGPARVKLGRFEYFDGTEVKAQRPDTRSCSADANIKPADFQFRIRRGPAHHSMAASSR